MIVPTSESQEINTYEFKTLSAIQQKIMVIDFQDLIHIYRNSLLKAHRINFFGIILIESGSTVHTIDFKEYPINAGDAIVIFPGQVHRYSLPEYVKYTVIAFEEDFFISKGGGKLFEDVYEILNELLLQQIIPIGLTDMKMLINLAKYIAFETQQTSDYHQMGTCQHLLLSILHFILRKTPKNEAQLDLQYEKKLALSFKSLVIRNISVKKNVEFFLAMLHVSKTTLQKATKLTFNKSPKLLIHDCLVLEAKRLLLDPQHRVQEVAFKLGFSDPTNFTKFFKKATQLTPEMFRRQF